MNADGSDPRRLTHGKGYDGGAFFSPDGHTLLYRGDRRSDDKMNLQLRTVGADGTTDRFPHGRGAARGGGVDGGL